MPEQASLPSPELVIAFLRLAQAWTEDDSSPYLWLISIVRPRHLLCASYYSSVYRIPKTLSTTLLLDNRTIHSVEQDQPLYLFSSQLSIFNMAVSRADYGVPYLRQAILLTISRRDIAPQHAVSQSTSLASH